MATLTKLLEIRIVASNLSGLPNKLRIRELVLEVVVLSSFMFFGDNEKYATSAPDIIADIMSRRITIRSPMIKPVLSNEAAMLARTPIAEG